MDLHPYDNKKREFRHTDPDRAMGLDLITGLLHLEEPPSVDGLLYDLSFFSGGIGIIDTLAITLPADEQTAARIIESLGALRLQEAAAVPTSGDELRWLLSDEDEPSTPTLEEEASRFINQNRKDFQPACDPAASIWFAPESGVNSWAVFWRAGELLSYLAYDQG